MLGDYRSINNRPEALGIERKTCIALGMVAALCFQWTGYLVYSLCLFTVGWFVVFSIQRLEPRLSRQMIRNLWLNKRHYSAKKFKG